MEDEKKIFVVGLCVDVVEALDQSWEVRNRVMVVRNAVLVPGIEGLAQPLEECLIADSRRPEGVKMVDFEPILS